jgi:tetratricopeptide (TPR) repeat protein
VVERLKEAEKIARELEDEARLVQILHWIANAYISNGFPGRGMPALFESYQLAEQLGDERLSLEPTFWMTMGMIDRDPRGGMEQMDNVIEEARKYRRWEIEAHALATKANAHARLGEFEEALDAIERAHEEVRKTDSLVKQADVALHSSQAFFDMGDVERGLEYSQRGTQKALTAHGLECAAAGYYATGLGNLQARNLKEAQRAFEAALKLRTDNLPEFQGGSEQLVNRVHAGLAVARYFGGDIEAIKDMERTLANAVAVGDDYTVAFIAQALGEAYTRLGDFERAERHLNTALDYYRRNDMRPYLARALQSLAYWYEQQDRDGEAEQVRTEARRLVEELPSPPVRPINGLSLAPNEPPSASSAER